MIFERTLDVPFLEDYIQYRDLYLRPDFRYRCAYCLTHEHHFLDGENGQIDHHRPLNPPRSIGKNFSDLEHVYSNLYWTCGKCNQCKGNCWPSDAEYAAGQRFLDPCVEDHDAHWAAMPDGRLEPTTPTGHYTIRHIQLNRLKLIRRRQQAYKYQQMLAQIARELEQRSLTHKHRQALIRHAAELRDLVSPPFVP